MKERERHIAIPQNDTIRLQEYGVGIFRSITTKSGLKKAIKKGLISVNSEIATTAIYIKKGDLIVLFEKKSETENSLLQFSLSIRYEDEHLAIINKPAGIIVSGNKHRTIVNALPFNLKRSREIDGLIHPQPVHRLDFPTSGLLVIAKTNFTVIALSELFATKRITKIYHAISLGSMETKGKIESTIEEKKATTYYEVLNTIESPNYEFLNLVRLLPETGRRHQLRLHLSRIGHPILGDANYGINGKILKGKGLYLHASSLEFEHPVTQESISIHEDLPGKFLKIFGQNNTFLS